MMSRPGSSKRRPLSGKRSERTGLGPGSADTVSYEDMLVSQYLDELRKSAPYTKTSAKTAESPYLQRLSSTHVVPTPGNRRPQSASQGRSGKPRVDPKFIADHSLWDPATPRGRDGGVESAPVGRRKRPQSAPVIKRPLSATYGLSRPTSAKSSAWGGSSYGGGRKVRALYKRQPLTIVVTAFKNGNRDSFARVAAPNIKQLLEICTDKLSLGSAGRRVFLDDGTEVFTPAEIPRDAEVYISMGESFKDPFRGMKEQTVLSKNATWTMNGLQLQPSNGKKQAKPKMSKRMKRLIDQSRRRVLVFKNGHGSDGMEIVADPDKLDDFLVGATARLDLGTYARVLYDWEGREVQDLNTAPVLDACLQTWTTPVLGPLWVSKGEGFSPKGVDEFLTGLIAYTRAKLKEAKHYQQQLQYSQDEATKERVEIVAILSMDEEEVEETLEIVSKDIEDFTNAWNRLKEQQSKIRSMVGDEQVAGNEYTLKHIVKFDANHRMVGAKGIRLKVYENGSYEDETIIYFNLQMASRGISDKKMLMHRLLEECSSSSALSNPKKSPALHPIARKMFDHLGKEIRDVYSLEYDQEVWLSFGEPWKNPFTYVLTATFDKVRAFDIEGDNARKTAIREQLMKDDTDGQEKASKWESVVGIPEEFEYMTRIYEGMDAMEREQAMGQLEIGEIGADNSYLWNKDNRKLMIFPEITIDNKKGKGAVDLFPGEAQIWVLSKSGHIFSKAMPHLVLGVSDQRISCKLSHPTKGPGETGVTGFMVNLMRKDNGPNQRWKFTAEGFIVSESTGYSLTYLGAQAASEDSQVEVEIEEGQAPPPKGRRPYLLVCETLQGNHVKNQRFALKQERMDNLGQWKYTQAENPEWNKRALSWPVKENGEYNDDYDWPMEGFMLPYAPPMKKPKADNKVPAPPLRLTVLKNGVRDISKACPVVGPDLTNMKKDMARKDKKKKKGGATNNAAAGKDDGDSESIDVDYASHCDEDLTVLKLELILFFERCTSQLGLPFAARRIFDEVGKEHFTLRSLKRDQLIYVSCGEAWSDPNLSKAEQQRRYLLANLGSDVKQIRQYITLRNPQNLVLEVEGGLVAGARAVIGECVSQIDVRGSKSRKSLEQSNRRDSLPPPAAYNPTMESTTAAAVADAGALSAHEIAHQRSEQRLNNLKWPWERTVEGAQDNDDDDDAKALYSNKDMYNKYKPRKKRSENLSLAAQQFRFDDGGYICSASVPQLVLGVQDGADGASGGAAGASSSAEVVLVKRRPDDILQRWILQENGIIQSKHNPQMVLSVSMPSVRGEGEEENGEEIVTYQGCAVVLQQKKSAQFGRANQRWYFDESTGFLQAFHTDLIDKEITAANKANVCTFAVMGGTELDQLGYVVELPAASGASGSKAPRKLLVCSSCARAMRGRHKIEKMKESVDFACSMGNAKELGIKQCGSFQCLTGKVDLSTHEAEHTLEEWEAQLAKLREELSVRQIAREISAARVPYTVKVLAYKNGEGRMKPGELIVGSSVPGILDQATGRLSMSQSARRLYTSDGQIVLDLDDLVAWVQSQYVKEAKKQLRAEARARKQAQRGDEEEGEEGEEQKNLMGRVDLDSDLTDNEEEDEEARRNGEEEGEDESFFTVGYEPADYRKNLDSWDSFIVVPNPTEWIEGDGYITEWSVYAKRPGVLYFMAFRQSQADFNTFTVIGQHGYNISEAGEHRFDVSANAMEVKRGDLIGFYAAQGGMIPFDHDPSSHETPHQMMIVEAPQVGSQVIIKPCTQQGKRTYSFGATVVLAEKMEERMQAAAKKAAAAKAKAGGKSRYIEAPPVEMVLRYPIEVWVSGGEEFVKPERVERSMEASRQQQQARAAVAYELQKEKHVLRQMAGRRLTGGAPGEYASTMDPERPVYVHGHWQEAPIDELLKHDTVHQLQTHLHEVKSAQKKGLKMCNASTTRRLYTQPSMIRVLVFPNGDTIERAQYVWGETIDQVLDNSTNRLNLRKPGKYLYNIEGKLVHEFSELSRDQLLCVSPSKQFLVPKDSRMLVEIKANWGRARKQYGADATDLIITTKKNPQIDVDPFGPSALTGGPTRPKRSAYPSTHARETSPSY